MRDGGRGGLYLPATAQPCNSEPGTPDPYGGREKRGRIGPWGRHRCSLFPSIAVPCKAGDVSRRPSSPLGRSFNPMVQGSSPWRPTSDFAGLRDRAIRIGVTRGRIGPSGAEFCERKIPFFALQRMCIDSKRKSRIGMAQLVRNPAHTFPRLQCHGRPRVACSVKLECADTCCLCPPL